MYNFFSISHPIIGDTMSIWKKNEIPHKKEKLEEDKEVDVLIIGAGITGMTTAYYLKDIPSLCIVDANTIGYGVTLNTTAKINYFQERVYTKIAAIRDEKIAKTYLDSQKYAIKELKDIIKKEKIDCDLKKVPSYVFATKDTEVELLEREICFLRKNGVEVQKKDLPFPIVSLCSYCVSDTYIFHPLKYLNGLYQVLKKKNIPIYEDTKIIRIEKEEDFYICHSSSHVIRAKKVIFACQYPFFLFPFLLPLKSYIEKSYIVISKAKKDLGCTCISSSYPTYSCRFYQNQDTIYQISLAESHHTAVNQNDIYHFQKVKEVFHIEDKDVLDTYSNVDVITIDHMPFIGKIAENMYIGCGYNTWGMTNGVLAAKVISDQLLGKENPFVSAFLPKRFHLSNIFKFPLIVGGQVKSMFGSKIVKNKSWYQHVRFIHKNGKSLGIYTDDRGQEHVVYNRCPHFGCSLLFNEEEKTWDCPCHSSRYDLDGKCIKGPSVYDISYKE